MNILFVNNSEINPVNSGIQRITAILAKAFAAQGWNCYGAYFEQSQATEETLFLRKLKLDFTAESVRQLAAFIQTYGIERIIVQECWPLKKLAVVRQALASHPDCRLFYCYHNKPGKEFVPPSLSTECFRLFHGSNKLNSLKKVLVALLPAPVYRRLVRRNVRRNYAYIHRTADKIVLLSAGYIPDFLRLAGLKETDTSKYIAVGNCLSFPEQTLPSPEKQKEVLIVGRLSDRQKRISTALRIWQSVEQSRRFPDWRLKIVGSGPDESFYHYLARKLRLQQVDFEGKQNPEPYYQRAAVFLMTSSYEGFGMVLTEAQQLGTVPVAFDSYSALHDIIRHQRNGIIVRNGDVREFARMLTALMDSPSERDRMAANARKDCEQFSEENMIQKWATFLTASESTGTTPRKS